MQDEGAYAAAWRSYRRFGRAFWILFVLFLPALALVGRAVGSTPSGVTVIFGTALAWMIAFAVVGYQKGNFSCPRCGEMFFRKFDDRSWRQGLGAQSVRAAVHALRPAEVGGAGRMSAVYGA